MNKLLIIFTLTLAIFIGQTLQEIEELDSNEVFNETQNISDKKNKERKLSQIKVEVETKKEVKKRERKLRLKSKSIFYKNIDSMMGKFGLEKEFDKKETDKYFFDLENKIYENMKKSLYKQKKYVQSYSAVVKEYQNLSKKYGME